MNIHALADVHASGTGAPTAPTQGFVAVSCMGGGAPDVRAVLAAVGADAPAYAEHGTLTTATWGWDVSGLDRAQPLLLCRNARRREHELAPQDVRRLLAGQDPDGLAEVLPTFAAVDHVDETTLVAAADVLGFRHLYHGQGKGFAVLSTSARAVGACLGKDLDREAIAVQSLLGWQVGQRTLFQDVHKLAPGELATLGDGRISLSSFRRPLGAERGLEASVTGAAQMLRDYVNAFLDDYPDAILQLTGGQDSRLLLSAVPRSRRRGLRTLTLGLPGNPDVGIAAELSQRYGLVHEVLRLDGMETLSPEESDRLCVDAARRLECMADPLAHAALTFVEAKAEPGARISGLGGEVARGFYYLGRARVVPVTRQRVDRLTQWRMFANESVSADALDPEFASWAREFAGAEMFSLFGATGRDWMSATDDFYLDQRMQRWAGGTETAVCFNRVVTNPMLDDRFIEIARSLSLRDKHNSMFLSRLQVELDDELARVPLDGRPAPIAYAQKSLGNSARQVATTVGKAARKVRQRASRANRPPAGGEVLARKVVEHWRSNPEVLDAVRHTGVMRDAWVDEVLAGTVDPGPSAVALMTNLRVAGDAHRDRVNTPSEAVRGAMYRSAAVLAGLLIAGTGSQAMAAPRFPNSRDTGVPRGQELRTYRGPCTITRDRAVIHAKRVHCDLNIRASGVVISRSKIYGNVSSGTDEHSGYSFTLKRSTVDASPGGARQVTAVGEVRFKVLRSNVYGGNRGANCWYVCRITRSYVHGQDTDRTGTWHESGIRVGAKAVLRGNTIACDAPDVPPDAGCSADLTAYGDFAAVRDNVIDGNLFKATPGGTCAFGGSTTDKPYADAARNIRFTDNVFERGRRGRCGYWSPITDFDRRAPGNVWRRNVWLGGGTVRP